jgi:hypothetical protein
VLMGAVFMADRGRELTMVESRQRTPGAQDIFAECVLRAGADLLSRLLGDHLPGGSQPSDLP